MKWLPTEVAVEARHAHLLAAAERRRLVRLARRTEDGGPPAGVAPRPISGNRSDGVSVSGGHNRVQGNLVGTDVTGTVRMGNVHDGVHISGDANLVGDAEPGARNIISGNGESGVEVTTQGETVVQGNYIGTDITGTAPIGNAEDGVLVIGSGLSNHVGLTSSQGDRPTSSPPTAATGSRYTCPVGPRSWATSSARTLPAWPLWATPGTA